MHEIDRIMLLIWNFEVLHSSAPQLAAQERIDDETPEEKPFAPLIDVRNTEDCNCSGPQNTSSFILKNNDDLVEDYSSENVSSEGKIMRK